ncbi:MAG: hypothetical protein MK193_03180 [Lentisphaeria bacterium]|nr:hypothetical protein [Lentisphaeria bacterium]
MFELKHIRSISKKPSFAGTKEDYSREDARKAYKYSSWLFDELIIYEPSVGNELKALGQLLPELIERFETLSSGIYTFERLCSRKGLEINNLQKVGPELLSHTQRRLEVIEHAFEKIPELQDRQVAKKWLEDAYYRLAVFQYSYRAFYGSAQERYKSLIAGNWVGDLPPTILQQLPAELQANNQDEQALNSILIGQGHTGLAINKGDPWQILGYRLRQWSPDILMEIGNTLSSQQLLVLDQKHLGIRHPSWGQLLQALRIGLNTDSFKRWMYRIPILAELLKQGHRRALEKEKKLISFLGNCLLHERPYSYTKMWQDFQIFFDLNSESAPVPTDYYSFISQALELYLGFELDAGIELSDDEELAIKETIQHISHRSYHDMASPVFFRGVIEYAMAGYDEVCWQDTLTWLHACMAIAQSEEDRAGAFRLWNLPLALIRDQVEDLKEQQHLIHILSVNSQAILKDAQRYLYEVSHVEGLQRLADYFHTHPEYILSLIAFESNDKAMIDFIFETNNQNWLAYLYKGGGKKSTEQGIHFLWEVDDSWFLLHENIKLQYADFILGIEDNYQLDFLKSIDSQFLESIMALKTNKEQYTILSYLNEFNLNDTVFNHDVIVLVLSLTLADHGTYSKEEIQFIINNLKGKKLSRNIHVQVSYYLSGKNIFLFNRLLNVPVSSLYVEAPIEREKVRDFVGLEELQSILTLDYLNAEHMKMLKQVVIAINFSQKIYIYDQVLSQIKKTFQKYRLAFKSHDYSVLKDVAVQLNQALGCNYISLLKLDKDYHRKDQLQTETHFLSTSMPGSLRLKNLQNHLENYDEDLERELVIERVRSKLLLALSKHILELIDREIRDHISPLLNDLSVKHSRHLPYAVLLYYSVKKNRRILGHLLKSDYTQQHYELFPENKQFLNKLNLNDKFVEKWTNDNEYKVKVNGFLKYYIYMENDPLHILKMGDYFNTCIRLEGDYNYSSIASAVEINKRVIYIKDRDARIVSRMLILLTEKKQLVPFKVYSHIQDTSQVMHEYLQLLCKELKLSQIKQTNQTYSHADARIFADAFWDELEPFLFLENAGELVNIELIAVS